jgi:hypothetical protein
MNEAALPLLEDPFGDGVPLMYFYLKFFIII